MKKKLKESIDYINDKGIKSSEIGIILGNFVAPIVMGVVFFFVVTPTGIIMRLLGKDLLNLKKNTKETYWLKKDNSNNNLKNQF